MVQSNHRRWLESSDVIQVVVKVRDGTLRIPSYLEHSVDANMSDGERISISVNVMFTSYTERLSKPLWSIVQEAMRRALADGALQPIETQTILLDSDGARFVVRAVSSLARKDKAQHGVATTDPLGDYDRSLFVDDLSPSHYVLLNKFQLLAGHVLLVTRRFDRQERLLTVEDFAALIACLSEVDGLGFYNGGVEAGASQLRKHLQFVPLPLAPESPDGVPMERVLGSGSRLAFRHAFARLAPQATAPVLHAAYRELLHQCGISAVAAAGGEVQSAPYNLLVRRSWMLVVPRSRACFESISVNGLGFAGSLFVRSQQDLDRVRAVGPMQVLRAVAMPQDVPDDV